MRVDPHAAIVSIRPSADRSGAYLLGGVAQAVPCGQITHGVERATGRPVLIKTLARAALEPGERARLSEALAARPSARAAEILSWWVGADGLARVVESAPHGLTIEAFRRLRAQRDRAVSRDDRMKIVRSFISALQPLHRRGLGHGALHRNNVFLDRLGVTLTEGWWRPFAGRAASPQADVRWLTTELWSLFGGDALRQSDPAFARAWEGAAHEASARRWYEAITRAIAEPAVRRRPPPIPLAARRRPVIRALRAPPDAPLRGTLGDLLPTSEYARDRHRVAAPSDRVPFEVVPEERARDRSRIADSILSGLSQIVRRWRSAPSS